MKKFPERRLAAPGRLPSDIDGDERQHYFCISCGEGIRRSGTESPALRAAKRVRCEECARDMLGLPLKLESQSVGYFHHTTGGGRRVIRDTKTLS